MCLFFRRGLRPGCPVQPPEANLTGNQVTPANSALVPRLPPCQPIHHLSRSKRGVVSPNSTHKGRFLLLSCWLSREIVQTQGGQRLACIVRGRGFLPMHLPAYSTYLELEHAAGGVHGTDEVVMGGNARHDLPGSIACNHNEAAGCRFTVAHCWTFPPACWWSSP
jgi:hypothetical protein